MSRGRMQKAFAVLHCGRQVPRLYRLRKGLPTGAISGKVKEVHTIDTSKCIKCGACMEKCKFGAIVKG